MVEKTDCSLTSNTNVEQSQNGVVCEQMESFINEPNTLLEVGQNSKDELETDKTGKFEVEVSSSSRQDVDDEFDFEMPSAKLTSLPVIAETLQENTTESYAKQATEVRTFSNPPSLFFNKVLVQARELQKDEGKSEETGSKIVEESLEGEEEWKTITPSIYTISFILSSRFSLFQ